jgi:hypothetical protein
MAYIKIYSKTDWQNRPNTSTPVGRTNLYKMEVGIDTLDNRVVELDTVKANQSTMNSVVQSITYNDATGVLTITKVNGTSTNIDTKLEKLAVNFSYNPTTQQLDITLDDGTVQHVDMSSLVTQYEFIDTDTIDFTVQSDGKIKASIIPGSITGAMLQPNYLADIIVQANIATAQAVIATTNADLSKRYAVGGVVPEDITDNSKYYRDQAKLYRDEAQGIVGVGIATDTVIGLVKGNGNVEVRSDGAMWANGYKDKATIADTSLAHFTTSDNGLAELFLNGKSNQLITVEGIQKFDKAKATPVKYILPTTGAVTNSSYSNQVSALKEIPSNETTVTISGLTFVQPNVPVGLAWYNNLGVFISGVSYQTLTGNGTYTKPAGAVYIRFTVNVIDLATAQLEWGTVAHAYTGFVPNSPSTDYSAPIIPFNASGTAKARATGNNELKNVAVSKVLNGITFTVNPDKSITITGTATAVTTIDLVGSISVAEKVARYDGSSTYKVSGGFTTQIQLVARLVDGGYVNIHNNIQQPNTIWCDKDIRWIYIQIANGATVNTTIYPKIEIGTVATPYTPYKENEAPITFSGYDLPNGVKDTVDFITGKKTQLIKKNVVSGGAITITDLGDNVRFGVQLDTYVTSGTTPIILQSISSHFKSVSILPVAHGTFLVQQHQDWNGVRASICLAKTYLTTSDLTGINAWLSANPVTVVWGFVTPSRPPIITNITDRLFVQTYATETNISIIDPVQTTFTAVAKSELWSRDYNHGQRLNNIESDIGDLDDLQTTSNTDLVESINEISVKVIKSVKDYGAKGDGVSDDTTAIQSAIDAISPYIWQGSAGSTTHAVKYGSLGFPKGVYRITSKLKINAGIKLVGVGIEKGSDWNTRETQSSCIFVDYDNESDFAFDTCPYNTAGVRVNNYLGTGADVNDGLHSTCEGIEFHNMTFYTNKTVRGFNMAISPSFIMNNCFVKGFTLSIRFSATWYSSIINTTMISRWRGISATNSTNNLNLYNVGIALAPDLPSYVSTLNDGCEYDLSFKASCGITGNYIGINAYGLTIEWFSNMINLGNSTGELYGIWTEQITSTLIYSYYSNLDISFNNIHCQMADVLNVADSNLRITSLSRDYNYSKITGWLEATDVPKVTLTGFKPKAADGAHMNDRALRSVFTDNLNNKSTKALIYVDSVDGNDINFGDTESRSLKTLKAAIKYSQELGKQVSILLKSGQTFDIDYTSISTNDLVISSFGSSSKPIINFSYEYSGISFNISKASITFKNLTINNYGAKNDGYRGIASMSVRGVLNVEFIDCFINLATNSHVVGAQANGSYLANIIYENCTIDGYGTTKTYGRLSYDIYRDAGDINAWNDIAINEYAFHTTKNALILGYGVANIMQKLHSTLDP